MGSDKDNKGNASFDDQNEIGTLSEKSDLQNETSMMPLMMMNMINFENAKKKYFF